MTSRAGYVPLLGHDDAPGYPPRSRGNRPPGPALLKRRRIFELQRIWIFVLTYLCYLCFHAVRKPPSVVKTVWHRNGTLPSDIINATSWAPFDQDNYATLFGVMDNAYLFTYAIGMFISGPVVERLNLAHCLGVGMIFSGVFCFCLGLAYFANMHRLWWFVLFMALSGLLNASGWPAIAAILGTWFPKDRRGFLFGLWTSCTSIGNIVGTMMAALFVETNWGLSFLLPAVSIIFVSICVIATFREIPTDATALVAELYPSEEEDVEFERNLGIGRMSSVVAATMTAMTEEDGDESVPLVMVAPMNTHQLQEQQQYQELQQQYDQQQYQQQLPHNHPSQLQPAEALPPQQEQSSSPRKPEVRVKSGPTAISFYGALCIPGVIPYASSLFFIKLVSYTFLFWLPIYIKHSTGLDPSESASLSVTYDIGGAVGAVITGIIADRFQGRSALVCVWILVIASPAMFIYQYLCENALAGLFLNVFILFIIGAVINGPYTLISTAVAVDLGSRPGLDGDKKALSTVTSIVDGSGSVGAAIGPLLTGLLVSNFDWQCVFFMLITSNLLAVVPLVYLIARRLR